MRKKIPTGSVFQKTYVDRQGQKQKTATWYLKYYVKGEPVEISSGTQDYDEALVMLRKRMADTARYADYAKEPERVRMDQLLDLLVEDYRLMNRKSTYDTELRVERHLRPFFGSIKAQALNSTVLKRFTELRRKQKAGAATINKELTWVRRALKLGAKHEPPLVERVPSFTMLPVQNTREGIIEHEQYRKLRDALSSYARIAFVIAYHTGARKGEIRSIRTEHIDMRAKRISLPGTVTKNGRARYLPIYGDMIAEIDMAISANDPKCPFLVQLDGKSVFDWEKTWRSACKEAKIPEALFHDTRRTALTNMMDAGWSEKEAMEISGHRTRSVFDRYHIVSERRLKKLTGQLDEHLKKKEADRIKDGTVQDAGASQSERVN